MKRLSIAVYLFTALSALAAAALQPEERLSLDSGAVVAAQNLFDDGAARDAADGLARP